MTISRSGAARLTITSIDDLLGDIPSLLGFHPEESLVVLVCRRGLLEVTARVDLEPVRTVAGHRTCLGALWERYPDAEVLAVAYTEEPDTGWSALEVLTRCLPKRARCRHAVVANRRQWYGAPGEQGVAYDPRVSPAALESAVAGVPVRSSRGELAAGLAHAEDPDAVAAEMAALQDRVADGRGLAAAAHAVWAGFLRGRGDLSLPDRVLLGVAAHDPGFAQSTILGITSSNADRCVAGWTLVVRTAMPLVAGPALTVLGVAAWVSGDGALQVVCLERAEQLAGLDDWVAFLQHVNRRVVPPRAWDDIRACYLEELVGAPTSGDDGLGFGSCGPVADAGSPRARPRGSRPRIGEGDVSGGERPTDI